jgi:hypothetical protein
MVLPPQRRWAAADVYAPRRPRSGEVEVGAVAGGPEPPEVAAGGTAEAPGPSSHRGWSCRGLPPAAGAAAGQPPTSPRRDDPRGLRGKLPDGFGRPLHRRTSPAGEGNGGEGRLFRRGADAPRVGLRVPGESSVFCFWFSLLFVSVLLPRPLDRGSGASGPPDPRSQRTRRPERCAGWRPRRRSGRRTRKKKRSRKRMVACDSLEKRRRAQAREGLPLEASPSTEEEDDDDDGMEVHASFSPEVGPRSVPASMGPSGGAGADNVPVRGTGVSRACPRLCLGGRGIGRGGGSRSPSRGSRRRPCGCAGRVPLAAARWGEHGGARRSPPCRRPGARSGPGCCSYLGTRVEGCRRGYHCPAYVGGGAAYARNPEAKASSLTCLRVRSQSARKSFRALFFPLIVVSVFSSKRRANAPIFTATKAVKRGAGTSAGASSHPLLSRSHLSWVLRWLYPLPGR